MTAIPSEGVGRPAVFIGSSNEAKLVAQYLQHGLEDAGGCDATVWSQGVFAASDYPLDSLVAAARAADFAALVVTPDDLVSSRGSDSLAPRDNVIFEVGLFMGVLGRQRTYLVVEKGVRLPSDLGGLTWLPYTRRHDGNYRAAVNTAVLGITESIRKLGPRTSDPPGVHSLVRHPGRPPNGQAAALAEELERLCANARAQGWTVRTNSATTLRLVSPRGRRHVLSRNLGDPGRDRAELRHFVSELREDGLRVNRSLRQPVPGLAAQPRG